MGGPVTYQGVGSPILQLFLFFSLLGEFQRVLQTPVHAGKLFI
jgi:hypothetical protein